MSRSAAIGPFVVAHRTCDRQERAAGARALARRRPARRPRPGHTRRPAGAHLHQHATAGRRPAARRRRRQLDAAGADPRHHVAGDDPSACPGHERRSELHGSRRLHRGRRQSRRDRRVERRRAGVRRLRHPRTRAAVGRLRRRRPARQGAAGDERRPVVRPRALRRQGAALLRPLELQVRRGGAAQGPHAESRTVAVCRGVAKSEGRGPSRPRVVRQCAKGCRTRSRVK